MLTRDEFLIRTRGVVASWPSIRTRLDLGAAGLIVALAAAVWVFALGAGPPWVYGLALVIFTAADLLLLAPPRFFLRRLADRVGLRCPNCGDSLFFSNGRYLVAEVVHTLQCPQCHATILTPGEHLVLPPFAKASPSPAQALLGVVMLLAIASSGGKFNRDYCGARYAAARSAADTAAVDRILTPLSGRHGYNGNSRCERWRGHNTSLDARIRAATPSVPLPTHSFIKSYWWAVLGLVIASAFAWRTYRSATILTRT